MRRSERSTRSTRSECGVGSKGFNLEVAHRACASFFHAPRVGHLHVGTDGAPDVGKFVLTLRRAASGRWLIAADMDNGNSR